MKRLLLLLIPLLLLSCKVDDDEDPRPYDGTWLKDSAFFTTTLELDSGSWEITSLIDLKGKVNDVDSNTITLTNTHIGSGGEWYTYSSQGMTTPPDSTKDWELSSDGNTLILTDPLGIDDIEIYSKQ